MGSTQSPRTIQFAPGAQHALMMPNMASMRDALTATPDDEIDDVGDGVTQERDSGKKKKPGISTSFLRCAACPLSAPPVTRDSHMGARVPVRFAGDRAPTRRDARHTKTRWLSLSPVRPIPLNDSDVTSPFPTCSRRPGRRPDSSARRRHRGGGAADFGHDEESASPGPARSAEGQGPRAQAGLSQPVGRVCECVSGRGQDSFCAREVGHLQFG